jgi:hypothetical protein
MRLLPVAALLSLLVVVSCAPQNANETSFSGADASSASPIVVHEFTFSPGIVTLDPTLGYSLARGEPGVSPQKRAEALGRAAAFNLADAAIGELKLLGYDVMAGADAPRPGERALVVTGDFRRIYEGHRHAGASIMVGVTIDYESSGAAPQRLTAFSLDSQRLPREDLVPVAGLHGEDVNYEATRLGAAIGHYIARLARTERWPAR